MPLFFWAIIGAVVGAMVPGQFFQPVVLAAIAVLLVYVAKYIHTAGELWPMPTLGIGYEFLHKALYTFFFLGGMAIGYLLR